MKTATAHSMGPSVVLYLAFCSFIATSLPIHADEGLKLGSDAKIDFANPDQAAAILGRRDGFVSVLSPFDRQVRLAAEAPVSESTFIEYVQQQARPWTAAEQAKITSILKEITPLIAPLKVTWPDTVYMVKTTGLEEANAPHCRESSVIIPQETLKRDTNQLKRILLHELFHILSRNSPELRAKLYAIVGFRETQPIPLPASLAKRKITNPDAPLVNCVIRIEHDDEPIHVAPVLYSRMEEYDTLANRSLFGELMFQLLRVEQQGNNWVPVLEDGKPILVAPRTQRSFQEQIGRNTGYIIHPEEVLADNFVHLLLETPNLPDRWVIERMRKELMAD